MDTKVEFEVNLTRCILRVRQPVLERRWYWPFKAVPCYLESELSLKETDEWLDGLERGGNILRELLG